jgi:hypothetical protein
MARIESPADKPREISSRSTNESDLRLLCLGRGTIPPEAVKNVCIVPGALSIALAIADTESPSFHRCQSAALSLGENSIRLLVTIKVRCFFASPRLVVAFIH